MNFTNRINKVTLNAIVKNFCMNDSEMHFISRLASYTLKSTLLRMLMVAMVGTIYYLLAIIVVGGIKMNIPITIYLRVIFSFIILSEVNVLFDNISERYFPIPDKIKIRILLHFVISFTCGLIIILYFTHISIVENLLHQKIVWLLIALGILFIFIFIMFSISLRITEKWIGLLNEIDRLKEAKLKSDYNSLQDQLNPHFLFNNLSVLKSMIIYDPQAAVVFTQNFTDVYRYVLQSSQKATTTLANELEFIKSYIGLHKERLGDSLLVNIDINTDILTKELPSLALQLLVENAIKHNIASKNAPLKIFITAKTDNLTVSNNINIKESTYSTQTGLKNLVERYQMLTRSQVDINKNNNTFSVTIPLL